MYKLRENMGKGANDYDYGATRNVLQVGQKITKGCAVCYNTQYNVAAVYYSRVILIDRLEGRPQSSVINVRLSQQSFQQ